MRAPIVTVEPEGKVESNKSKYAEAVSESDFRGNRKEVSTLGMQAQAADISQRMAPWHNQAKPRQTEHLSAKGANYLQFSLAPFATLSNVRRAPPNRTAVLSSPDSRSSSKPVCTSNSSPIFSESSR